MLSAILSAQNGELLAEYNASVFYVYKHQMGEKGEDGPGILFSAEMFVFLIEKQPMSTVFSARICVLGGGPPLCFLPVTGKTIIFCQNVGSP